MEKRENKWRNGKGRKVTSMEGKKIWKKVKVEKENKEIEDEANRGKEK